MKSIYYLATSLDGFIADEAGGVGWLDELVVDHSSSGYDEFYSNVDGLIMGRATYDFIFNYGEWPYGDKPCWICSTRPVELLSGCRRQDATDVADAFQEAQVLGLETLWMVGGGKLAASMFNAGLITHVHVTLMPILLGSGIRLVDRLPSPVWLQQESVLAAGGSTDLVYRVTDGPVRR